MTPALWQVSTAPSRQNYASIFLRYGVALITPGDTGPWSPKRRDLVGDDVLRRFAAEVKVGDILLLRSNPSTIQAVGIIAGEYQYLPQFDDVNGLDLQHGRRVRWCSLPEEYSFGEPLLGTVAPRFSRVLRNELINYAQSFINSPPDQWKTAPLPQLPEEQPQLLEIPRSLRDLVAQVHDLLDLYQDETNLGDLPAEDELLAHYIVPFLRALGWPPEEIGVKWRNVDVATFKALPRSPDNIQYIIEAKRLGTGGEAALQQAKDYLEALAVNRDIVITDGIRYRLFSAAAGCEPVGYANLSRLKTPALQLFALMRKP
jgi:hypothetical protein